MPFARNPFRKLRKALIHKSSSKQDEQPLSLTPITPKKDVFTLPTTEGLDRKDALVDDLADDLDRALWVYKSLDVAATVLNGVDVWVPLLGATLVLAKEGIEVVQASKVLKHSAHAYIQHVLRLLETVELKVKRAEASGEKMDPKDIKHFEIFNGLLKLNLKQLKRMTQMSSAQAWFGLKGAEHEFRKMQGDIESYVSWLSLKAIYDTEHDNEEMVNQMALDRKEVQMWAQQTLRDTNEIKKMLLDLGKQADHLTKMLPDELKDLRAEIQAFHRKSKDLEGGGTAPSMDQPTVQFADKTAVYWAEELGNRIVWRATRIETLLSAHKLHCQDAGSSLVINEIMADGLTDLLKAFDDSCPPGLVILDKVPKLSSSTSTKASSTQLKSPPTTTPNADENKAVKSRS